MASGLQDALPVTGSGNYLYILLMEEADSDIQKFPFSRQPPQGPHSGLGILTRNPLPYKQVPYSYLSNLCVHRSVVATLHSLREDLSLE